MSCVGLSINRCEGPRKLRLRFLFEVYDGQTKKTIDTAGVFKTKWTFRNKNKLSIGAKELTNKTNTLSDKSARQINILKATHKLNEV